MSENNTLTGLSKVPEQIANSIFQYLDLLGLSKLSQTNKYFSNYIQTNFLKPFKKLIEQIEGLGYHVPFTTIEPLLKNISLVNLNDLLAATIRVCRWGDKYGYERKIIFLACFQLLAEANEKLGIILPNYIDETNFSLLRLSIERILGVGENVSYNPVLLLNQAHLLNNLTQVNNLDKYINNDFLLKHNFLHFKCLFYAGLAFLASGKKSITALIYIRTASTFIKKHTDPQNLLAKQISELADFVVSKTQVTSIRSCLEFWFIDLVKLNTKQGITNLNPIFKVNKIGKVLDFFKPKRYTGLCKQFAIIIQKFSLNEILPLNLDLFRTLELLDDDHQFRHRLSYLTDINQIPTLILSFPSDMVEKYEDVNDCLDEVDFGNLSLNEINALLKKVGDFYQLKLSTLSESETFSQDNNLGSGLLMEFWGHYRIEILYFMIHLMLTDYGNINSERLKNFYLEIISFLREDDQYDKLKTLLELLHTNSKSLKVLLTYFPKLTDLISLMMAIASGESNSNLKILLFKSEITSRFITADTQNIEEVIQNITQSKLPWLTQQLTRVYEFEDQDHLSGNDQPFFEYVSYDTALSLSEKEIDFIAYFVSLLQKINYRPPYFILESIDNIRKYVGFIKEIYQLKHLSMVHHLLLIYFDLSSIYSLYCCSISFSGKNISLLTTICESGLYNFHLKPFVNVLLSEIQKNKNISIRSLDLIGFYRYMKPFQENIQTFNQVEFGLILNSYSKENIVIEYIISKRTVALSLWKFLFSALFNPELLRNFIQRFSINKKFLMDRVREHAKENINFYNILLNIAFYFRDNVELYTPSGYPTIAYIFMQNVSYAVLEKIYFTCQKNPTAFIHIVKLLLCYRNSNLLLYTLRYCISGLKKMSFERNWQHMNNPIVHMLGYYALPTFQWGPFDSSKFIAALTGNIDLNGFTDYFRFIDQFLELNNQVSNGIFIFLHFFRSNYSVQDKFFDFLLDTANLIQPNHAQRLVESKVLSILNQVAKLDNVDALLEKFDFIDLVEFTQMRPLYDCLEADYSEYREKNLLMLLCDYSPSITDIIGSYSTKAQMMENIIQISKCLAREQQPLAQARVISLLPIDLTDVGEIQVRVLEQTLSSNRSTAALVASQQQSWQQTAHSNTSQTSTDNAEETISKRGFGIS